MGVFLKKIYLEQRGYFRHMRKTLFQMVGNDHGTWTSGRQVGDKAR